MSAQLEHLKQMIVARNRAEVSTILPKLPEEYGVSKICTEAVYPALNEVRQLFKTRKLGIPELILSLDLVRQTVEGLSRRPGATQREQHILLGVIEGDTHDMGKNIVREIYRGYGFQVTDLGKNIAIDRFVEAVQHEKPDLVGISTMMSTTIDNVRNAIESIHKTIPGTRIMLGGAFIKRDIAAKLGADGYAESVATLIEETESVFGG